MSQLPSTESTNSFNLFGNSSNELFGQTTATATSTSEVNQNVGYVDVELSARTTRKSITTIKGLSDAINKEKLAGKWKKMFCCRVTVKGGDIELSGDHRDEIIQYLLEMEIVTKSQIRKHGY